MGFLHENTKLKVQASIQGDSVRVVGKSRDDLQDVIKEQQEIEKQYLEQRKEIENEKIEKQIGRKRIQNIFDTFV